MIKTPLRYPGGKARAIHKIAPLIPATHTEYREPFLGGGSVFIHQKQIFPQCRYWINDLHTNLYCFWKQTQENLDTLIDQVWQWCNEFDGQGKTLYEYLKNNIESFDDTKKGAAFFVLNRITFSGTTESGGFSQHAYLKRFTLSSVERVRKVNEVLQGEVNVTNYDYSELLNATGSSVFVFLDPPYYSATKSALYGKSGGLHRGFDHQRLADMLQDSNHQWLLTYDDSPFIRNLYSFAHIKRWDTVYGMRNVGEVNQKAKELFISNYKLPKTS